MYVSILLGMGSLFILGVYTWYWRGVKYRPEEDIYDYLTWSAYACWGLCGLIGLIVCCCWEAIQVGIAVFKTTSQYV